MLRPVLVACNARRLLACVSTFRRHRVERDLVCGGDNCAVLVLKLPSLPVAMSMVCAALIPHLVQKVVRHTNAQHHERSSPAHQDCLAGPKPGPSVNTRHPVANHFHHNSSGLLTFVIDQLLAAFLCWDRPRQHVMHCEAKVDTAHSDPSSRIRRSSLSFGVSDSPGLPPICSPSFNSHLLLSVFTLCCRLPLCVVSGATNPCGQQIHMTTTHTRCQHPSAKDTTKDTSVPPHKCRHQQKKPPTLPSSRQTHNTQMYMDGSRNERREVKVKNTHTHSKKRNLTINKKRNHNHPVSCEQTHKRKPQHTHSSFQCIHMSTHVSMHYAQVYVLMHLRCVHQPSCLQGRSFVIAFLSNFMSTYGSKVHGREHKHKKKEKDMSILSRCTFVFAITKSLDTLTRDSTFYSIQAQDMDALC